MTKQLLCATTTALLQCLAAGAAVGPDVSLREQGDTVVLANGIVQATIDKAGARLVSLRFRDTEMVRDAYYSMDGGKEYRTPAGCSFRIAKQTPDHVDVGMRRVWKDEPQAFDTEVHYVLRRGDSGLYSYALLEHPVAYPATRVGEWRFVWKLPDDLLDHLFVDDLRQRAMPSSRDTFETTPIKEITRYTSGVRAGQYECKYDYNAEYWSLGCWGHAGSRNGLGAWIVLGGHEYFNDGPTKQDLTAASGINHLHFGMNHYNASSTEVAAGQSWRKLYGPFLLYGNHTDQGVQASWADARARAESEAGAWPYAWMAGSPDYPTAAERGSVAGRFLVRDPLKPQLTGAGAWVGLAQPPAGGNWQFDSMGYQFWVRADAEGRFTIPHVRPGRYTLYAFVDGAVGEYSEGPVTVAAGQALALGDREWRVPRFGTRLAWEIGVPDRTAREFRHGNDYFQGYLWQHVSQEWPNPLEYTVGKSDWRRDWNWAQTRYSGPDDAAIPHRWNIRFTLPEAPARDAVLTLAIASADRARIQVYVNDPARPLAEVTPAVEGGNALLREGIHAKYCVEGVTIPAGRLRAGENIISLLPASVRLASSHVMYDSLSLEVR